MRYTKGAMDENELARYNSTPLCGLDNTLPNSYANSLLQVNVTLCRLWNVKAIDLIGVLLMIDLHLGFLLHSWGASTAIGTYLQSRILSCVRAIFPVSHVRRRSKPGTERSPGNDPASQLPESLPHSAGSVGHGPPPTGVSSRNQTQEHPASPRSSKSINCWFVIQMMLIRVTRTHWNAFLFDMFPELGAVYSTAIKQWNDAREVRTWTSIVSANANANVNVKGGSRGRFRLSCRGKRNTQRRHGDWRQCLACIQTLRSGSGADESLYQMQQWKLEGVCRASLVFDASGSRW